MRWATKALVAELNERLEARYGTVDRGHVFDPTEELVSCILSQHTSDANSFPAFYRLREALPTWEAVVAAGPEKVAEIIRSAGLANQKAQTIIRCLEVVRERTGDYSIDFLGEMPMREARDWLTSLPGVGPKTASIVLCFSFGMEAIPVDTHVYRVCRRIGLIPEKMSADDAHDALLKITPEGLAYRFHMACIQHGRAICKAPTPICEQCVVRDSCRWYKKGGPAKLKGRSKSTAKDKRL